MKELQNVKRKISSIGSGGGIDNHFLWKIENVEL
jgi:hypothetical protein